MPDCQAIVATTFCLLAASTLPGVEYYYVFQHAGLALGPFAWAHWIIVGVACGLGVLAHALGNRGELAWALHYAHACGRQGSLRGGLAGLCHAASSAPLPAPRCSPAGLPRGGLMHAGRRTGRL